MCSVLLYSVVRVTVKVCCVERSIRSVCFNVSPVVLFQCSVCFNVSYVVFVSM